MITETDKTFIVALGDKVHNRHIDQTGVVVLRADNASGNWYHVTTVSGSYIGYWHETDLDLTVKTVPPSTRR